MKIFFTWIKNIKGVGDELYLDLVERELSYEDMKNFIAFCIDIKLKWNNYSLLLLKIIDLL